MAVVTDLIPFAELKRFLELYTASPAFASSVQARPDDALTGLGLTWAPRAVQELWDVAVAREVREGGRPSDPSAAAYRQEISRRLAYREEVRQGGTPDDPRFRRWRERQISRLWHENGPAKADSVVHAPFAIELARGCSVGCWFCGVGAEKLTELFGYTPANAALFQGVLGALRDVVGPGAGHGFCYWASDPLDNPDYERFLQDFKAITGRWPQTTTALALKDPERTRALVRRSEAEGCAVDRFSVLTLKLLERVHDTFTAQELERVECVCQNRENTRPKALAGKALQKAWKEGQAPEDTGSIACVSGFLLNLVDRTVKLITPADADERWPLGYVVHAEATFRDAEDFALVIRRMIDESMAQDVTDLPRVRPNRRVRLERTDDGFRLSSKGTCTRFEDPARRQEFHALAALLQDGRSAAEDLALLQVYQGGVAWEVTMAQLRLLFERGLLDEEPV